MNGSKAACCFTTIALATGCGISTPDSGNESLGIARFDTTETANQIVVTGYADDGTVLGQIDLIHGVFDVLDDEGGKTGEVATGRLMHMKLGTQNGFVQLLDRLADQGVYRSRSILPLQGVEASMFVMDPHVKGVTDQYDIHFAVAPVTNDGEVAFEYYQYDFQAEVGYDDLCWYQSAYTNSDGVVVGTAPSCVNPATSQYYGVDGGNANAVCNNANLVKHGWYANFGAGATGVPWDQEQSYVWADLNQCCWRDTSGYFWGHKVCAPDSSSCYVASSATGLPAGTCNINTTVLQQWDGLGNQEMYIGHQW